MLIPSVLFSVVVVVVAAGVVVVVVVVKVVVRLMDKILHDPKDPKLWELWYIPCNG